MPIPGPGTAISMNTIAGEFGGTVPHSLSEYYRGGGLVPNSPVNAAIPTSGTISMGNFYGSSNRTAVSLTIAANTNSYDVYTNRGPSYVPGSSDITVTINPGVTVGATSTPAYALLVPSAFSPGDTVTIVNNGLIQGCGGGAGSGGAVQNNPTVLFPGNPGGGGGNAIYVNRPTVITNNGTVAGGGGGGGGGGAGSNATSPKPGGNTAAGGSGGGGGSGSTGGGGGGAGIVPAQFVGSSGFAGSAGTSPAGGAGGPRNRYAPSPPAYYGGAGGTGGGRGAAGATGETSSSNGVGWPGPRPGGSGGGAGNYIVGNPFVTWPVVGTRQGGAA